MTRFPFCFTRISKVGKCAAFQLWTPTYFLKFFSDIEEISPWVNPASYQAVKTEVIFLMEKLDTDASKSLSLPEILNDTQNFLTSQVTHYGDVYKLKHLREHIFLIDNDTA